MAWRAAALFLAACTVWAVATFPVARGPLAVVAATAATVTLAAPGCWALLVPALIPAADLAPWSGRFILDEYDISLLAILAALVWSIPVNRPSKVTVWSPTVLLLCGLVASYAWGVALATRTNYLPGSGGYQSFDHAIRIAKAPAFAIALLAAARLAGALENASRRYAIGSAVGLGILILHVAYERWRFPGLFNFESDFRAVGPFVTMHTGGASIDAYLLLAAPMVACCWRGPGRAWPTIGFTALSLGTVYAVLATVTRATIAIAAVQGLVLALGKIFGTNQRVGRWVVGGAVLLLLGIGVAAVTAAPFWRQRFSTIERDWATRMRHWHDVREMRGQAATARWFGLGTGAFRHAYLHYKDGEARPDYRIVQGKSGVHLELSGSSGIYFGQYVPVAPRTKYTLALDFHGGAADALLSFALCEKTMLYSFRCVGDAIGAANPSGWRHVELEINSDELGVSKGWGWLGVRPINLAFNVSGQGSIHLDNVRLIDPQGHDLMRNGDFERRHEGWFYTADNHEPWHAKNVYLHLLSEHGWLGLAAFLMPTGYALWRLARPASAGNYESLAWCCSIVGFLALGLFDSLLDAPRIALQYYVLLGIALTRAGFTTPLP